MKMNKMEEIWMIIAVGLIIIAMGITGYQAFAMGMGPPSHQEHIDPQAIESHPEFSEPGVYELGDNQYEVIMTLQAFEFQPGEITVPEGAEVTFRMATKDVVHGVNVPHTNLNTMVVPGFIQEITQTFHEAGEYIMVCNEYCGVGHHMMSATITVEE
ncbi:cytochrome c oxidase subunit II [Lacicoccus alkaliphilus]|uniref:Cytochrome aa3 subunit 2 n=1 Tax=Lacicoccus alkaliphilus DSM 16010 TaxID=1123231 RepID=A0A1M7G602_9BACL|nr:cytochrome c oxidase subunit II [Salinicoccus alkaliphilus]SHM11713.1 cytochrome c oxidase subunit 2 [Salinicoccus alkaliphilus DSM 16010]